jgi:hypothetical protein
MSGIKVERVDDKGVRLAQRISDSSTFVNFGPYAALLLMSSWLAIWGSTYYTRFPFFSHVIALLCK